MSFGPIPVGPAQPSKEAASFQKGGGGRPSPHPDFPPQPTWGLPLNTIQSSLRGIPCCNTVHVSHAEGWPFIHPRKKWPSSIHYVPGPGTPREQPPSLCSWSFPGEAQVNIREQIITNWVKCYEVRKV